MKKLLIGLSGVAVLALAVILFVNAGTSTDKTNNATTELKADCAKCPSAATCADAEKAAKTETAAAPAKACCPEAAKMATSSASCETACPMKKAAATN